MRRVVRIRIAGVNQVHKQPSALYVPEKADAEPRAFVRAFDQPRKIGDYKRATDFSAFFATASVRIDDTEIWLQSRERIICNLWTRRRNHGNQRGLACVRKAN